MLWDCNPKAPPQPGPFSGVAALIAGIVTLDPMIAILGTVLGYIFAWSGHFLIELNRLSMLAHPVWSFQCDVRVFRFGLAGNSVRSALGRK